MAWEWNSSVTVTYYFRDDDGAGSRHYMYIPGANMDSAATMAIQFAELLQAVSNCALWKISISHSAQDDGSQVAQPGSKVYRRSIFTCETAQGAQYVLQIPGVVESMLLQPPDPYAGIGLDLNNVAVAAFVDELLNGVACAPWGPGVGGDLSWQGDDLVSIVSAYWGYERARW